MTDTKLGRARITGADFTGTGITAKQLAGTCFEKGSDRPKGLPNANAIKECVPEWRKNVLEKLCKD